MTTEFGFHTESFETLIKDLSLFNLGVLPAPSEIKEIKITNNANCLLVHVELKNKD